MQFHPSPYSPKSPDLGNYGLTAQRTQGVIVETLRQGDSGGDVAYLHEALDSNSPRRRYVTNAGAISEMTSTTFGPKTKDAVKAFQKDNGLSVDGIVGPNTWKSLSTSSTTFEVKDSTKTGPSLTLTASGDDATRVGPAAAKAKGITKHPWFYPVAIGGGVLLLGGIILLTRRKKA